MDTELSDEGKRQVARIAALVRLGEFNRVYSSPLTRALTLATAIGDATGVAVDTDDRLTEIAMGPWEGLTRDEIAERFPDMFAQWHDRPDKVTFPDGESLDMVAARVRSFMDDLFDYQDAHPIAVVSHDAVIKVAVMLPLGLELRYLHRFRMRNGSVSILRGNRYEGSVETIGSLAHLTGSPFDLSAEGSGAEPSRVQTNEEPERETKNEKPETPQSENPR
jgi:probable phosphoglycerate mutase